MTLPDQARKGDVLRVIQARYADWRPVKGRKVLQITLEVPLEQQGEVLSMLGAPMPDRDLWVAVAILREERGEMKGGRLAQQAGILCNEGAFQQWARAQMDCGLPAGPDHAAGFIRDVCGVRTRAHLDHDDDAAAKFREMKAEYEIWLRAAA